MQAEQALLGAHFSQAKKVLGRNLQSASFSKSARIFAERALDNYSDLQGCTPPRALNGRWLFPGSSSS